jgi:uncharacterized protein YnzC (UPF0291/DUF896 family)
MLSPEKMQRINELARKKKAGTLTKQEEKEQKELREEYLETFRTGMRHHIEGMKVVDPEGNDVTPAKLKEIQRKKGIHQD